MSGAKFSLEKFGALFQEIMTKHKGKNDENLFFIFTTNFLWFDMTTMKSKVVTDAILYFLLAFDPVKSRFSQSHF